MTSRTHGPPPHDIVAVHGGPGGAGELEFLCQELARRGHSVLEPMQTRGSVEGQITELAGQIEAYATTPVTLLGWSWGAWLAGFVAAARPDLVAPLILVGSGPLEAHWAESIMPARLERMTPAERDALSAWDPEQTDGLEEMVRLMEKAQSFEALDGPTPKVTFDAVIHMAVWPEAAAMRRSGELLERFAQISCPVIAIHGRQDPHPAEGVRQPLREILPDASFLLLDRCGHKPWREVHARQAFFDALEDHLPAH